MPASFLYCLSTEVEGGMEFYVNIVIESINSEFNNFLRC